jgi:hypothetical protein
MIHSIHWTYNKSKMIKGTICCYICGGKLNILPTTFSRPSRNTAAILRLSRRLHYMKYYLINRINNFIRYRNNILFHHVRKNYIKPTNLIPYTCKKLSGMITKLPTSRTQIFGIANYFTN